MGDKNRHESKKKDSIDWKAFAVQTISGAIAGVISGLIVYIITQ